MRLAFFYIVLLCAFAFIGSAPSALAQEQGGLIEYSEPKKIATFLPTGDAISQDIITEKMQAFGEIPFDDENLEYNFLLPKTWQSSSFGNIGKAKRSNYRVPTNIARYFGTSLGGVLPYVWIEVQRPNKEILLNDYVYNYFVKRGIRAEAIHSPHDGMIQAVYVELEKTISYAKRSHFIRYGDKIIHIMFVVPFDEFNDMKHLMGLTLNSFTLTQPPKGEIEDRETVKLMNLLKYEFPKSWTIDRLEQDNALHVKSELHRYDSFEGLQGLMFIEAIRKTQLRNLPEEVQRIKRGLARSKINIGDILDSWSFPGATLNYEFSTLEVYKAEKVEDEKQDEYGLILENENVIDQEVWLAIAETENYIGFILLITPDRENNFKEWARNRAGLDIIARSFELRVK